ncbi:MAG: hypothetical protein C4547_02960 [Phycisphaerales bacterium]|nr:MAG: hypothetical protein C4547_02960 [Phycisphaerales bacterium]
MVLVEQGAALNVAILVWNGVELLDFAGPGEVFSAANGRGSLAFNVFTVAPTREPVISQRFLSINPNHSIDDCPPPDILIIPGGHTQPITDNDEVIQWVRRRVLNDAQDTLTVCTGAFILAKTGLLDGAEATTYHGAIDALRQAVPTATVHAGRRFVDNGDIITAAGVSAGIDGALHLVFRLQGYEIARSVAEYMEYPWDASHIENIQFYYGQQWEAAQDALERYLRHRPDDGTALQRYGHTLLELGRPAEALAQLDRAAEAGQDDARFQTHRAAALAALGRADEALVTLEKAYQAGLVGISNVLADPHLLPLHPRPGFRQLMRRQARESQIRLCPASEPGIPLVVEGSVRDHDGNAVTGAEVYVFHTGNGGSYSESGGNAASMGDSLNPRLFGYLRTGSDGRFQFRTIHPGPYPDRGPPAHVHVEVTAEGFHKLVTELMFEGDPRLTPSTREWAVGQGFVITPVTPDDKGVEHGVCDLTLRPAA